MKRIYAYKKLYRSGLTFTALQLLWSTWQEMADFANVGAHPQQAIGVYIDQNGKQVDRPTGRLGLRIPIGEDAMIAVEDDWIVKGPHGELFSVAQEKLEYLFEVLDA